MKQKYASFISSVDIAVRSWHAVGMTFEMLNFYLSSLRSVDVEFSTSQNAVVYSATTLKENSLT